MTKRRDSVLIVTAIVLIGFFVVLAVYDAVRSVAPTVSNSQAALAPALNTPEPEALGILRALGRVEIESGQDLFVKFGYLYWVHFSAGDVRDSHGKYYIFGGGSGGTLQEAAEDCLADFKRRLGDQLKYAKEIARREAQSAEKEVKP